MRCATKQRLDLPDREGQMQQFPHGMADGDALVIGLRLADYVGHLKQAAEDASSFVEGRSKSAFMADRRTQQAVIMSLMTIGDVAARIVARYPEFADRHAEVPWRQMRGMRNRLVSRMLRSRSRCRLGNHIKGHSRLAPICPRHRSQS